MRELKLNTAKIFKIALICYAVIFLAGIAFSFIFGINFDINFRGGTKIAYAYTGEVDEAEIKETVKDAIGKEPTVSKSTSVAGDVKTFEVGFVGKDALSDSDRLALKKALKEKFKDNIVDLSADEAAAETATENADEATTESAAEKTTESAAEATTESAAEATTESAAEKTTESAAEATTESAAEKTTESAAEATAEDAAEATTETAAEDAAEEDTAPYPYSETSVNPTIAGSFFAKSLFAVLLTALLVIVYVGIRFKKIGGISAAITALCALILDILVTFCVCVLFRLQIDSNYIAVVLTILGYSLNDTIVVYDRVRENRRFEPDTEIGELVNKSINAVKIRNFVTTLTTFCAVMTIVVVSELYGLTSLRTFAIPMAFGLLSGCVSSLFIAGPLWVKWKTRSSAKKAR